MDFSTGVGEIGGDRRSMQRQQQPVERTGRGDGVEQFRRQPFESLRLDRATGDGKRRHRRRERESKIARPVHEAAQPVFRLAMPAARRRGSGLVERSPRYTVGFGRNVLTPCSSPAIPTRAITSRPLHRPASSYLRAMPTIMNSRIRRCHSGGGTSLEQYRQCVPFEIAVPSAPTR